MKPLLLTIALLFSTPAWAETKKPLTDDEKIKIGMIISLAATYEAAAEKCEGKIDNVQLSKNKIAETINELNKHLSADDNREINKILKSGKLDKSKKIFFGGLSAYGNTPSACGMMLGAAIGTIIPGGALDYYEQLTGQKF